MDELKDYIFSWNNPLIYIVLTSVLILIAVFVVIKFVIIPYQQKQFEEKSKLERKNKELMSLFAELDPDPIIRVNAEGLIKQFNQAATDHFSIKQEANVRDVLSNLNIDWEQFIETNKINRSLELVGNKYYVVDVKGIKDLNTAQIYFHDITDRIKYEKEIEEYKNRLRILSDYLDTQQEEVRDRVSAILHDDIGQQLFSLRLMIENNKKNIPEHEKILEQFDSTYETVRGLSHELKPVRLKERTIVMALGQMIRQFNDNSSIEGKFSSSSPDIELGNRLKTCVFRVVQEALINIVKHSKATEYFVHLKNAGDKVNLVISDNGVGMVEKDIQNESYFKTGIGLFNMKERVEYLNGEIKIDTSPNNGFTIHVNLPMI